MTALEPALCVALVVAIGWILRQSGRIRQLTEDIDNANATAESWHRIADAEIRECNAIAGERDALAAERDALADEASDALAGLVEELDAYRAENGEVDHG